MQTNQKGIDLIKHFESIHDGDLKQIGLQPKLCPANIWTTGYGRALIDPKTGQFLKGEKDKQKAYSMFPNITEKQAEQMLKEDLAVYEAKTNRVLGSIKQKLNENQYSALVSFVYNLGEGSLAKSTLLKKIWVNPNDPTIRNEFMRWISKGTPYEKGLTRRREAEANLYFTL